jgi:hypothetical protein
MGALYSKCVGFYEDAKKTAVGRKVLTTIPQRLGRLTSIGKTWVRDGYWLGSNILWATVVGSIVLVVPVVAEFERECDLYDRMMSQIQQQPGAGGP